MPIEISAVERSLYRFAANTVLRAGAGTGKTEALTTLYAHLVAGATAAKRASSPRRIAAVTFTEKAATEMRDRIAQVLTALAGRSLGDLPRAARVVQQSLAVRGDEPPQPAHFAAALDAIVEAPITTLHALCGRILRTHAIEARLSPDFEVLDETLAAARLEDAVALTVRDALAAGEGAVRDLLVDAGVLFATSGPRRNASLGRSIAWLCAELAETGLEPEALLEGTPYASVEPGTGQRARQVLGLRSQAHREQQDGQIDGAADGARDDLGPAWQRLLVPHQAIVDAPPKHAHRAAAKLRETLAGIRNDPTFGGDDVAALCRAACALKAAAGTGKTLATADLIDPREAAISLYQAGRSRDRAVAMVRLVKATATRYRSRKRADGVLDFSDLTVMARDLLRDRPDVRRSVAADIDVLMVDEFQDTNAVQRDFVFLLRAQGDVGKRVPTAAELLPDGLFVVGDRKQSIYGFRNADVAVFEAVADAIRQAGGLELSLQQSFRSTPPLVEAQNELARAALRSDAGHSFELQFDVETEALTATAQVAAGAEDGRRESGAGEAPVALIELDGKDDGVDGEARAIATYLRRTLDGHPLMVRDGRGGRRAAHFGDVALLISRFTHLGAYQRAFDEAGVPYEVVRGRGLLQTVEARDLLALGRVLAGFDDGRSLLTFLRGPMVALRDDTLLGIVVAAGGVPSLLRRIESASSLMELASQLADARTDGAAVEGSVAQGAVVNGGATQGGEAEARGRRDDETRRFVAACQTLLALRPRVDRIGLAAAMEVYLEATAYVPILLAQSSGLQRAANVDRIMAELRERELGGADGRRVFLELCRRVDAGGVPEADVSLAERGVVTIMTVHQSKGLQFPVVVAADLGRRFGSRPEWFAYDRSPGARLAVRVRAPGGGGWLGDGHFDAVSAVVQSREKAERLRLFYVQITRARDHLVLIGKERSSGLMRDVVAEVADDLVRRDLLVRVPADSPLAGDAKSGTVLAAPSASPLAAAEWSRLVQRAHPAVVAGGLLEVPVTQLEDFALCPRRFRARHVLALPEHPKPRVPVEQAPAAVETMSPATETPTDPRLRGTLIHRVLEHIDLAAALADPQTTAIAALERAGGRDLAARILPFLRGEYFHALAAGVARGDIRVERELPFSRVLTGKTSRVLLTGQVDLVASSDDGIDIVDYKVTSPRGKDPTADYRFQLEAYALSLAPLGRGGDYAVETRAFIQFLDGEQAEPVPASLDLAAFERRVADLVDELVDAQRGGAYAGRPEARCRQIHCGYRFLCHGGGGDLRGAGPPELAEGADQAAAT